MRKRTREQLAAIADELKVKAIIVADNLTSVPPASEESLRRFVLRNERDRLWEAFMVLTRAYATHDEEVIQEQGQAFALTVRGILVRIDDLNSLDEITKEGADKGGPDRYNVGADEMSARPPTGENEERV